MYDDGAAGVLVGSNVGLFRLSDGVLTAVPNQSCLPSVDIRSLRRDRAGRLWVGTNRGLARLEAQWPIEEKVNRADHVIRTDGTPADSDARVRVVYERLKFEG